MNQSNNQKPNTKFQNIFGNDEVYKLEDRTFIFTKESEFWLKLLRDLNDTDKERIEELINEASELKKIL